MPAALPGSTLAENQANPSAGRCVILDPLSGPKASPLDARKITGWSGGRPTYANDPLNCSTGALQTGIGFGSPPIFGASQITPNFSDDYIPGITKPGLTAATDSTLVYIGGGRSDATGAPTPYDESMVALGKAGQGGSRDGGTTPFTAFPMKTVTATGTVANGNAVETGWNNRSGVSIVSGQSVFGSGTTPNADVT
jgi:hypothetical protein